MLRSKYPLVMNPVLEQKDWASFEKYPTPREGMPLKWDQSIVQVVRGNLGGGADLIAWIE